MYTFKPPLSHFNPPLNYIFKPPLSYILSFVGEDPQTHFQSNFNRDGI